MTAAPVWQTARSVCIIGVTAHVTKVVGIKRWIDDPKDAYAVRIEMSDGPRSAKLDLQPRLARLVEIDVRVQSLVEESVSQAMRTAMSRL